MAHIGVSVDDETKSNWEDYVGESDYGSMSELIRTAVRKEVRRGDDDSGGVPRELEQELTRVGETQRTLQEQMDTLLSDFEEVSDMATGKQYPEHIIELGHDIAGELEEIGNDWYLEMHEETKKEYNKFRLNHAEEASLSELLEAFEYLEENLSYIESAPQGPSDYYRVRGGR